MAVDGKSNFDGIFTAVTQHDGIFMAVTQHDGKFLAVDGFSFFDGKFSAVGGSNFELVFVSRIPQIRLKKSVTEILLRRFCDRNSHTL